VNTTIDYDAPTREGRSALRLEIKLNFDGHDAWGSALSVLGDVCDVLSAHSGDIPASAGYSPGLRGPALEGYHAVMFDEMYDDGIVSIGDLEYWARVLDRYADLVPESKRY
jgi:hypothetical protein